MSPTHPEVTVDTLYDALHEAGWSIGDIGTDRGFLVMGTNGESRIHATGATLLEAWQEAYRQAKEMESDDPFFVIPKGS